MKKLVIDLEMCCVPKDSRPENSRLAREIIQIGAVLLNENYKIIAKLRHFVKPQYGAIDPMIRRLTGIDDSMVENAPVLSEVLPYILNWAGTEDYEIYAWSDADYKQLSCETREKNITSPEVEAFLDSRRWIDYQKVVTKRGGYSHSLGLENALNLCGIYPEGRFHDGLDDAVNTARMIAKLEHDEDFEIYNWEEKTEPLWFSMGSLLEGLRLAM